MCVGLARRKSHVKLVICIARLAKATACALGNTWLQLQGQNKPKGCSLFGHVCSLFKLTMHMFGMGPVGGAEQHVNVDGLHEW